jgi:hypothetical protein
MSRGFGGGEPTEAAIKLLAGLRRARLIIPAGVHQFGPKSVDGYGVVEGFYFSEVGLGCLVASPSSRHL